VREEVRKDTIDEIAERVLALPEGRRFYVLYEFRLVSEPAPAAHAAQSTRARKAARPAAETVRESLISLRKRGFNASIKPVAFLNFRRRKNCSMSILRSPFTFSSIGWCSPRKSGRG